MPAEPSATPKVVPGTRVQRPRTSPSQAGRRLTARQAAGRSHEAGAGGGGSHDNDGPDFELLEYEWPDLPPLPSIKDAITRNRVSHGISYLLPVDKGCNSINNRFRTDLRAMFQEPYASDDLQYDDSRVCLSSKVHFLSNTGDTKWTRQHLASVPININAESERMRQLYAHSAPTGGSASRRTGLNQHKLRTRSSLYLPLKAAVPPELVKLTEEVEAIIRSVTEADEDAGEDKLKATNSSPSHQPLQQAHRDQHHDDDDHHHHHQNNPVDKNPPGPATGPSGADFLRAPHPPSGHPPSQPPCCPAAKGGGTGTVRAVGPERVTALGTQALLDARLHSEPSAKERFNSYEELKNARSLKSQIPDSFKSQYLDDRHNQEVWDWLHYGEEMSDFDFFLSVCG